MTPRRALLGSALVLGLVAVPGCAAQKSAESARAPDVPPGASLEEYEALLAEMIEDGRQGNRYVRRCQFRIVKENDRPGFRIGDDMVGNDFEFSTGGWTCGKDGQSVPVSQGLPTVLVSKMTVGGVNG